MQASSIFDIASRPEDDVMFLAESSGSRLWQVDVSNGTLTNVGPYAATPGPNIVGLAFSQVPEPATLGLLGMAAPALLLRRRRV